ncbi:MAG: hypothetical protein MMC33_001251 [Icmadophila ericetorum]|nr:hypothetical protein [Icmadophila ericetorum]
MSAPPFKVKATYDYSSPHDDDLSFPNGQIITVTDEEDADWYYGEYLDASGTKQQGLFPKNFVEKYEPETPPRPTRPTRPKKEPEQSPIVSEPAEGRSTDVRDSMPEQSNAGPPPAPKTKQVETTGPVTEERKSGPPPLEPASQLSTVTSAQKITSKPPAPSIPKSTKPAAAEPTVTGSFRDRIAAFNKPAAPVAPIKPAGLGSSSGSGFIKKPFVAPPPSKNAYVPMPREGPPQKVYRREEDPSFAAPAINDQEETITAMRSGPAAESGDTEPDDQPKPTSLKERIALLQKQQMEQAARHADAAQKKDKPRRPPKKRNESYEADDAGHGAEEPELERVESGDTTQGLGIQTNDDESQLRARSSTRRHKSKERAHGAMDQPRDIYSDGNEADQSGAGDTEDGDLSTGRDDSDEKPRARPIVPIQRAPQAPPSQAPMRDESSHGDEEKEGEDPDDAEKGEEGMEEEEEEEEEEEIDPEVRRRMEIRERMAKMSGGMGMAGMFGGPPLGGLPGPRKQKASGSSAREKSGSHDAPMQDTAPRAIPGMALPGMQRVQSPEDNVSQSEAQHGDEEEQTPLPRPRDRRSQVNPDRQDDVTMPLARKSEERPVPPRRQSQEQGNMPPGSPSSRVAPPVPGSRPMPPLPPTESRLAPQQRLSTLVLPERGSESDDEVSQSANPLSLKTDMASIASSMDREAPPIPSAAGAPPVPNRSQTLESSTSQNNDYREGVPSTPKSPIEPSSPSPMNKRTSRIPPIPSSPQARAPPPPPPMQAPPSRRSTAETRIPMPAPKHQPEDEEEDDDEEVTEYDGDYDTDIGSSVPHKNALTSHARDSSFDEPLTGDEASYHHSGLPSLGPPPPVPMTSPPRAGPPPPPREPPKHARKSSDMPRAAPPPPPPPKEQLEEEHEDDDDDDGEDEPEESSLYGYAPPQRAMPQVPEAKGRPILPPPKVPGNYDDLYSSSPPKTFAPSPVMQSSSSYTSSPVVPPPAPPPAERTVTRQSLDVPQHTTNIRKSLDGGWGTAEQSFIASDIDVGRGSQWWVQRNVPPPIFQNRQDMSYKIDESVVAQQGASQVVSKVVSVIFMDYSQTVVTARFDRQDPSRADIQQHHEPPPTRLRQDQLENAYSRFGARIAEAANSKNNSVVGDGTPSTFILTILGGIPDILPPVGSRAFGALVYSNLANATVQQNDEIRAGDIVSFRNAKMQGHRGTIKAKYNMEVGKPDHVGIVVDWDGTKKKIRAWEQGRESKKVKIESFKLSDLKSGEVKVWRVMPKSWVGW